MAFLSCGKIGPPVAPSRITVRTSQLTAVQRGATVVLTWPPAALGGRESSSSYVSRIDVYRLVEARDQEPVLDPDDFEETASVIGYMDRATAESQIKETGGLLYTDALNLTQADLANIRLRYAVRYVNQRGQTASFSNTVAIEPWSTITSPPHGLGIKDQAQDRITLEWKAPDANEDGTKPASVAGYNVYRTSGRAMPRKPLNSEPLAEPRFTDTRFQYDTDYFYVVRAVSQAAAGLVESTDSVPVAITPRDTFPPSTPDPVSAASANGVVSLFWPRSPERDVVGYNIYRADSAEAPDKDWVILNPQPLAPVTFRDDSVVIDRRYSYKVSAVDKFNNESKPSKAVSEAARP
ncbi:MAG TPA: hypothetical protein VJH03_26320 [Blastocatellia bacterium]|nr:hypothetical protein [Blastocatellia bacterium]